MQDNSGKEKTLMKIRKSAFLLFCFLLVAGIGMIGYGSAVQIIQYLIDGGVILVVSPIFLAMDQFAKRKMKEMGI